MLALDEGAPGVVGVGRRGTEEIGGDERVGGGLAHHREVRDGVGPQHDRRRGEVGDVQRGSEGVGIERRSSQREIPRDEVVWRVEVALGLGQPPETAMAPAHLDVPGHRVQLVGGAVAHDGLPAHAWLAPGLGLHENETSLYCWRQSHDVAMRSRSERAADEPRTK